MARVTYLLGAGASADALPIVNKFEEELKNIIHYIRNFNKEELGSSYNDKKVIEEIPLVKEFAIKHLTELLEGCIKHRSVDTYAKRLFLTINKNKDLYRRTKCSIILFFELYKLTKGKIDKRYDAFLATILNRNTPRFPSDINILSWNYDYEFEQAYLNYVTDKSDIHEINNDLNIFHKNNNRNKSLSQNFGIVKINGTCGFYDGGGNLTLGLRGINNYDLIKKKQFNQAASDPDKLFFNVR